MGHDIVNDSFQFLATHNKKNIPGTFKYDYLPELNITEKLIVEKVIAESRPDIIVNTAAYVGTDKCDSDFFGAYLSNVKAVDNICNTANKYVPNVLFVNFSTTATMDPDSYGMQNFINEKTKRSPKTWYGMLKLLGEYIVKEKMINWINLLPVFLFGDYPDDNASIWAKVFKNTLSSIETEIKLNLDFYKQYEYSKNIVDILYKIIMNEKSLMKDVIITGNEFKKFDYFISLANVLFEKKFNTKLKYRLKPEADYLKNHVADNFLMLELSNITKDEFTGRRLNFSDAILKVMESC